MSKISLTSAHGPWTRCVAYKHLLGPPPGLSGRPQPLWGGASKTNGARFTPPGSFDSIYIASDPITSLSARNPGGLNIVLFPDRIGLSPGMYLAVHDPHGHLNQRIGTS